MSKVYTSATELIGKTPLLELTHIEKAFGLKAKIVATINIVLFISVGFVPIKITNLSGFTNFSRPESFILLILHIRNVLKWLIISSIWARRGPLGACSTDVP